MGRLPEPLTSPAWLSAVFGRWTGRSFLGHRPAHHLSYLALQVSVLFDAVWMDKYFWGEVASNWRCQRWCQPLLSVA